MTIEADRERESKILGDARKDLFIGGTWRAASNGRALPVEDPATREILCSVADATPEDGMAALDSAVDAQAEWAATAPRTRGEVLRRAYELLIERADDLALLMTMEMGKPLAESRGEVAYAAEFFRWFAEEAVRIDGDYQVAPDGRARFLLMHQPVGPCLLITPWNFPLAMGARKIAPALAAGCTIVIKPADLTPLSTLALADILVRAGLPMGVLNVVVTSDAGALMEPLIRDGRARKLSFTGSTPVGRMLLEQCADKVLRTSMELGGNAPFVVFSDADVDVTVEGAMAAKIRNGGEACTAANRFFVHREIAVEFATKFAERISTLRTGRGTDEGVAVGPLINQAAIDKVQRLVDDARKRGARVVTGGSSVDAPGYFYQPTVLNDVPRNAQISTEEIFGPVAAIFLFDTESEAIAAANSTEYGLVSYIFTTDLNRALRVSEQLDTGMVGLNTGVVSNPAAPFGGVKQSGLGREGGRNGIDEYLETKYVALNVR